MKFLESTNFFVRVVLYDLVNRNKAVKLKFRLTPMIHIGSKEYYTNIIENIKICDEIFYEGIDIVDHDEPFYKRISLRNLDLTFKQYKLIADKLGLVTQTEHFHLNKLEHKLTHADFDLESGEESWNELMWFEKIKLSLIQPIKLFIYHQGLSREILAKHFMTSHEEAYLAYGPIEDEKGTSTNFTMNEREQIIFNKVNKRMETESNHDKTIGIVYGAGHMKSIARYLIDQHHFVPKSGIFVKVFDVL